MYSSWPLTFASSSRTSDIAELRRFGGVPFLSPLRVPSPSNNSKNSHEGHEPIACIAVHSTAGMLSIAARSVPLVVRDGLSVFFCGRLCGWYPSAGSAKCNPRVFVEGGPGALLALPQRSIQCNAETKYKHARPVLFVRSGMACGWKILQRWMHDGILWGVLSFRLLLSLDTHVLVLAFCSDSMQRRHHRLSALWVIAGLTTFLSTIYPKLKNGTIRTNIY